MDRQVMIVIFVLLIIATLFYSSSRRYTQGMVVADSSKTIISMPDNYGDYGAQDDRLPPEHHEGPSKQYSNKFIEPKTPVFDAGFIQSNPVDCEKLPKNMKVILHEVC